MTLSTNYNKYADNFKYCTCTFGGDRLHGYIHIYVDHHLHTKLHKNQSLFILFGKVKVYLVVEGLPFL